MPLSIRGNGHKCTNIGGVWPRELSGSTLSVRQYAAAAPRSPSPPRVAGGRERLKPRNVRVSIQQALRARRWARGFSVWSARCSATGA
jgi:hypothetical protein